MLFLLFLITKNYKPEKSEILYFYVLCKYSIVLSVTTEISVSTVLSKNSKDTRPRTKQCLLLYMLKHLYMVEKGEKVD